MRSFIAIELPSESKSDLMALTDRLRKARVRVSWGKPANLHLTLRFLGEVDEEGIEHISTYLARAYERQIAFPLTLRGAGAFPNTRRPAVVWAGVEPADGPILGVQQVAEDAAQSIGIAPEKRPFKPHITLGRVRNPREAHALKPALDREKDFAGGEFAARGVALFSSELTRSGAIHTRLQTFSFESGGDEYF